MATKEIIRKQAKPTTYNFSNGAKFQVLECERQPEDFEQKDGKMIPVYHITAVPMASPFRERCIETNEFPYFTSYGKEKEFGQRFDISIVLNERGQNVFSINDSKTTAIDASKFNALLGLDTPADDDADAKKSSKK